MWAQTGHRLGIPLSVYSLRHHNTDPSSNTIFSPVATNQVRHKCSWQRCLVVARENGCFCGLCLGQFPPPYRPTPRSAVLSSTALFHLASLHSDTQAHLVDRLPAKPPHALHQAGGTLCPPCPLICMSLLAFIPTQPANRHQFYNIPVACFQDGGHGRLTLAGITPTRWIPHVYFTASSTWLSK